MRYLLAIVVLAGVCMAQSSSQDSGPTTVGPTLPKKTKPAATAPKPAPTDSTANDSGPMIDDGPYTGPEWHRGTDTTPDPGTPGVSSSKDTKVNIPPPNGEAGPSDVQEMKPYDPHKADKSIEVGDYYFHQKNYRAAESRYREALEWKPGDAVATYKLGEVMEKIGNLVQARQNYQAYLKILPDGPLAKDAKKALSRIEVARNGQ
jgi:tetratricopeptide (TPR) repeat protein